MRSYTSRLFFGLLILSVLTCVAIADDVETVKEKLFQAKKEHDAEVQKFRKAVFDSLDKQESEARAAGNKKELEQLKAEREAFETKAEFPSKTPESLLDGFAKAKTNLDKSYTTAIKDCIRLKADDLAAMIEKEQKQFQLTAMIGNPTKTKLDRAKVAYKLEFEKYREDVGGYFDKREETVRNDGNKKLLDQLKDERRGFEEWGELPKSAPATLRPKLDSAKTTLEKAYGVAIKEFVKAKQDDEAAAADKEFQAFSRLHGSWKSGDNMHIFVFRPGGTIDEFVLPSGEKKTMGEWSLGTKLFITVNLKNGYKFTGPFPTSETMKMDPFGPGATAPGPPVTFRRIVK